MTSPPLRLWFHAEGRLTHAPTVWVELPDGRPHARFHRRRTAGGQPRWDWLGGDLPDFSVELEPQGTSYLVTGPHGAPFGRIREHGLLVPRLTATDAHRERFTIELDGRLLAASGTRGPLGEVTMRDSGDLQLQLPPTRDDTLRTLLMAAPLCHVNQVLLLQAA